MTDLSTDEGSLNDIAGLLDFDGCVTPRLLTPKPVDSTGDLESLLFTQDTSPSSTTSVGRDESDKHRSKREMGKNRQRRYRQRLKDSRDELQRQVNALSEQLNALRQKRNMADPTGMFLSTCSSQWLSEARIQRGNRLQSEAEQQRLLAAVNCQSECIKRMRQAVNDRLTTEDLSCRTLHSMTSARYTYLQQLDGCYARVDNIMEECAVASLPETTINSTHRHKTDGGVAYFQHVNKVMLPFGFQQTSRAVRTVMHEHDEPVFCGNGKAPDNDVFIKSRVLTAENTGVLAQRLVGRSYMKKERFVLVWKISSEGEDGFKELHADETGWVSVEPSVSGVVLSICVQQVPMRCSSGNSREPALGKFYNMLHESLEADKQGMTETMGRLLLDEVLSGIDC